MSKNLVKKTLFVFLGILTLCGIQAGSAFAQLAITSSSPAATETPSGSFYYVVNNTIPRDAVYFQWDLSNGMDTKFVQDIKNITVKEKGSTTEINFDLTAGTKVFTPTGQTTDYYLYNADFKFISTGTNASGSKVRRLELKPTTVFFDYNKTYVITIYKELTINGLVNQFVANNNTLLNATYSYEFTTQSATLISLGSFQAIPGNREVLIKWTTESEIDNSGFNILRAESPEGPFIPVNNELIQAEGAAAEGAEYVFVDSSVKNRKTYYYKLEDVDTGGVTAVHDPAEEATPRFIYQFIK
ncbi:MAG: hypothetical protein WCQ99_03290 [Pseudomonadota bacterium]